KQFEEKWDQIKLFIEYGMISDEKFNEKAMKFALVKDTEGKYYTLDEYRTLIEADQTDKDGNVTYIYATDKTAQYSYIEAAQAKGYNVLLLDGQLDVHFIGMLEQKIEKSRFVRVDSNVADKLVDKNNNNEVALTETQKQMTEGVFKSQIPEIEKTSFIVMFEAIGESAQPIVITQNEFMRRMKDMSALQPGMMNFYGEMPDSYSLIINTENPVSKKVIEQIEGECKDELMPIIDNITKLNNEIDSLKSSHQGKKDDEIPVAEKEEIKTKENEITELRKKESDIFAKCGTENKLVKQLIDLALLSNNMLKGEALSKFIKRSVDLL
ncbi:MAG: molecular chaperone HtpG, partial [Coprobacter sp.]|nr:molecular chaperone HtpG [Coprobacter sp.]